jgi:hypothetical protein
MTALDWLRHRFTTSPFKIGWRMLANIRGRKPYGCKRARGHNTQVFDRASFEFNVLIKRSLLMIGASSRS